jgi:hypothetical protein
LVRDLMTDDYGVVLVASLGRECPLENPAFVAGFSTLGLMEGMKTNRADFNRDGVIHLNELERRAGDS